MKNYLVLLFCLFSGAAFASTFADSSATGLPSVTEQEYLLYTQGKDFGLGNIAEQSNYPSPENVLQMASKLGINAVQKRELTKIQQEKQRKSLEMGKFIMEQEAKFNDLFKGNKINEGSLVFYTNKIGLLQGELRNAILKAHYQTWKLLTVSQLKKYQSLRKN